jgi:hypothetical protein
LKRRVHSAPSSPANAILAESASASGLTEGNNRRSLRKVSIRLPGTTCAWVSMIIAVLRGTEG